MASLYHDSSRLSTVANSIVLDMGSTLSLSAAGFDANVSIIFYKWPPAPHQRPLNTAMCTQRKSSLPGSIQALNNMLVCLEGSTLCLLIQLFTQAIHLIVFYHFNLHNIRTLREIMICLTVAGLSCPGAYLQRCIDLCHKAREFCQIGGGDIAAAVHICVL